MCVLCDELKKAGIGTPPPDRMTEAEAAFCCGYSFACMQTMLHEEKADILKAAITLGTMASPYFEIINTPKDAPESEWAQIAVQVHQFKQAWARTLKLRAEQDKLKEMHNGPKQKTTST